VIAKIRISLREYVVASNIGTIVWQGYGRELDVLPARGCFCESIAYLSRAARFCAGVDEDDMVYCKNKINEENNVRRVSTKLRGVLGSPQPDFRQLFHYGNNDGKWAPTTGLREHQYAGYLDDYYAASRALPQRTPQTPQLKALTALEDQRASR